MSRYINADEFAKHIKNGSPVIFDSTTINEIIFAIDTEPRVDVEPVIHAHWISLDPNARTGKAYKHYCSRCERVVFKSRQVSAQGLGYAFCPHCGAKMDEETK